MKRLTVLSALLLSGLLFSSIGESDLISLYKKGPIRCLPDPGFAAGVDWESLFLDSFRQIKAAPDGSVFVSNQRDHTISKFGPDGKFLKTFGKKGKGPGDLDFPGNMSILDGQLLVVADRIPNHRINLFHLDGTFFKILKTQNPPYSPEALSRNKVAYITSLSRPPEQADSMIFRNLRKVIIKDVETGKEKEVVEYTTSMNPVKDGTVVIAATGDGQLLVGMTLKPELDVYDLSGKKIRSIPLDITPLKVNSKIRKNHQMRFTTMTDGKATTKNAPMGDTLPYYSDLSVDDEGNILVFLMTDNPKQGPYPFQVYSPAGKLLCQSELDPGEYAFFPDPRFNKFDFTRRGIFCILHKRGDDLETPHLIRIRSGV